jgi:hypothetical protein
MMDVHRNRDALRQQIEHELGADPTRSNREIARLVSCDHKTVGAMRGKMAGANSPKVSVEENPQRGEIDQDDRGGEISWGSVPDDAYIIPPQGQTAAFIDKDTGDLVILQDQSHLWQDDAVIRIGALEVGPFIDGLVAMVRRRDQP